MRWKQLRQADLNLLVAFAVFAEELSISAAAERLLLSQPAASRTLQRLRALFADDLLVRGAGGYQLTPTGVRLQAELNRLLPQLDSLLGRAAFDPTTEPARFRLTGPDNVCSALAPLLCRLTLPVAPYVAFEFVPWSGNAFADLDRGHLDIALSNDDVLIPSHLNSQLLYREDWHCIVAKESPHRGPFPLDAYLAADHIAVSTIDGVQSIPDKRLAVGGHVRNFSLRVPYFGTALECIAGTRFVLTATSSIACIAEKRSELRVLPPPDELIGFSFLSVWHPRLESDPSHRWLRQELQRVSSQIK
jgi:DNA-binding transcriptional LysR family regulator